MAREKRFDYPNQRKASSKVTKWITVLLLLASAVLMVIVSVGGWDALQGAKPLQVAYILLYVLCAFFIARWRSGVLPVVAALAMVLLIFAAISGPEWFQRDKPGFEDTALGPELLGLITLLLVPLQILLIASSMTGFSQKWTVEVEIDEDELYDDDYSRRRRGGGGAVAMPA